jgi:hypothetical protein
MNYRNIEITDLEFCKKNNAEEISKKYIDLLYEIIDNKSINNITLDAVYAESNLPNLVMELCENGSYFNLFVPFDGDLKEILEAKRVILTWNFLHQKPSSFKDWKSLHEKAKINLHELLKLEN